MPANNLLTADTTNLKPWNVSPTVLAAGRRGAFDDVSVKDPSIVFWQNEWHVFYTSKGRYPDGKSSSSTGYVRGRTLQDLAQAPRVELIQEGQPLVAPQVFYFRPHKLWYLIAQIALPSECNFHAVYLTNPDLQDVHGWSRPEVFTYQRTRTSFWIDFWIICDATHAHFFYTDHDGRMFRQEAPLSKFPYGFSSDELAVEVRGVDARSAWRLHEASHIYAVKNGGGYLALLEAVRPHPTRPGYWDSRSRFMFAMHADSLRGPWTRVESRDDVFWGAPELLIDAAGKSGPYHQVSHPEAIRAGFDERLEIESEEPDLLLQGFDATLIDATYDYDFLPWELALASKNPLTAR